MIIFVTYVYLYLFDLALFYIERIVLQREILLLKCKDKLTMKSKKNPSTRTFRTYPLDISPFLEIPFTKSCSKLHFIKNVLVKMKRPPRKSSLQDNFLLTIFYVYLLAPISEKIVS